jgi:hypothetical protein
MRREYAKIRRGRRINFHARGGCAPGGRAVCHCAAAGIPAAKCYAGRRSLVRAGLLLQLAEVRYDVRNVLRRKGRVAAFGRHGHVRGVQRIVNRTALSDEIGQLGVIQTGDEFAGLQVLAQMRNALALRPVAAGAGGGKQLSAMFGRRRCRRRGLFHRCGLLRRGIVRGGRRRRTGVLTTTGETGQCQSGAQSERQGQGFCSLFGVKDGEVFHKQKSIGVFAVAGGGCDRALPAFAVQQIAPGEHGMPNGQPGKIIGRGGGDNARPHRRFEARAFEVEC